MIDLYKQQLNPVDYGMRLEPYFTFKNHSKIIMTDNIIYWGSSNFSDESCENFECGTISTDKDLIEYVKKSLFTVIKSKSVPYYKHNFAIAILNLKKQQTNNAGKIPRVAIFEIMKGNYFILHFSF